MFNYTRMRNMVSFFFYLIVCETACLFYLIIKCGKSTKTSTKFQKQIYYVSNPGVATRIYAFVLVYFLL